MNTVKILTELDDMKKEVSAMISKVIMSGGIPGKLISIEEMIDKIKASITEA